MEPHAHGYLEYKNSFKIHIFEFELATKTAVRNFQGCSTQWRLIFSVYDYRSQVMLYFSSFTQLDPYDS